MQELKRAIASLHNEVKEIKKDCDQLKIVATENTVDLKHHMKRTDLNESRIEKLEYWLLGSCGALLVTLISILVTILSK